MEKDNGRIYTLFAGVNGAGKSTIYNTIGRYGNGNRVNSDEILVSNGGDWRNERDQIKAGMEAVRKIDYFIRQRVSFNQETTLAGRSILRTIQKAREHGFSVNLYYIGLDSIELAIERVKSRVAKGGHGIEEAAIKKRYEVSLTMLKRVVPLCDAVVIYDNSKDLDKIARCKNGSWILYNEKCEWFNRAMPEVIGEKKNI